MDQDRFDTLARLLGTGAGRRKLIGGLSAVLLAGLATPQPALACKKVGRKCDKNKDCCDGARCRGGKRGKCRCKSGFSECNGEKACKNLNTDSNHCGDCGNACSELFNFCVAGECRICPAGADHCVSPPSNCEGRDDCFCLIRLEDGVSTCAKQPRCDEPCDDESDCPGGPLFCASVGEACCPGSTGQGRCAELCGA